MLSMLLSNDFEVITAGCAVVAMDILHHMSDPKSLPLMVSDQQLGHMSGLELFDQTRLELPDTIRVLYSGAMDHTAIESQLAEHKVFAFLTKPLDPGVFLQTVIKAHKAWQLRAELQQREKRLTTEIQILSEQLTGKRQALAETRDNLERAHLGQPLSTLFDTQ